MSAIRAARKAKGLTAVQVAALAGVDPSTVSRVERGLQGVRAETAKRIAVVLGLDPAVVVFAERAQPVALERRASQRRSTVRRAADRGPAL